VGLNLGYGRFYQAHVLTAQTLLLFLLLQLLLALMMDIHICYLKQTFCLRHTAFNLLAPELFFLILAHPVYKM
jgi:hypothetical protein